MLWKFLQTIQHFDLILVWCPYLGYPGSKFKVSLRLLEIINKFHYFALCFFHSSNLRKTSLKTANNNISKATLVHVDALFNTHREPCDGCVTTVVLAFVINPWIRWEHNPLFKKLCKAEWTLCCKPAATRSSSHTSNSTHVQVVHWMRANIK